MITNNMKVERLIYSDIKNTYRLWNAWRPDFSFPLDEVDAAFLDTILIEEAIYHADSLNTRDQMYESLILDLHKLVDEFNTSFLLTFSHDIGLKNKLRSHKWSLKMKSSSIKEHFTYEYDFDDGCSALGASININDLEANQFRELINTLPDNYLVCYKSQEVSNLNKLELMGSTLIRSGDMCYHNFYKVLQFWFLETKIKDLIVIRLGGNGDSNMSIQKFINTDLSVPSCS